MVTALELAKRLVILKPKNNHSLNTLFKIQIELKDWMGARKTLVLQQNLDKKTRSINSSIAEYIIEGSLSDMPCFTYCHRKILSKQGS